MNLVLSRARAINYDFPLGRPLIMGNLCHFWLILIVADALRDTLDPSELVGSRLQQVVSLIQITVLGTSIEITEKLRRGLGKGAAAFAASPPGNPCTLRGQPRTNPEVPLRTATGLTGLGGAHMVACQEHRVWSQKEISALLPRSYLLSLFPP